MCNNPRIKTIAARRRKRPVRVGPLTIGGDAPIVIQSMTNVHTRDVDACINQIQKLAQAGCELVRLAVPTAEDTQALKQIISQVAIPICADVHFHYQRALEAVDAGVAKIRLNPGNIQDRKQVKKVIQACSANGVAIRVGVNQGSIRPKGPVEKHAESDPAELVPLMIDKLREYVSIFQECHFDQLVLSAKCHDAARSIAVNRALSDTFDWPVHLGVTHAGTMFTGAIRSAAALGALLAEGIGDTIRISLTGDPLKEIEAAQELLQTLQLRHFEKPQLISCPTCGRCEIDIQTMAEQVQQALKKFHEPITVAVMGCVVNGPGEAAEADIALCGGKDKAMIYRDGKKVAVVSADQAVQALLKEVRFFIDQRHRKP